MSNSATGQKVFGSGYFYGVPTAANPTPTAFGAAQNMSADFKRDIKPLWGTNQLPIEIASGKLTVTGKVEMATLNGARAALWDDRIGSIEIGKDADFVMFDTHRTEWQPLINPLSNLVYAATGDSVRDVFVAGEQVVQSGKLTRIDEEVVYREIPRAVARFGSRLDMKKMNTLRWPVS